MGSPRITNWLARLAFSLVVFTSLPVQSDAPAPSGPDAEPKVFRFNVSPNGYPPYLINKDNETTGIMWTVVSTVAERLGYTVEAHKVPRKRVDQMLHKGIIDGTSRAREWTSKPENFVFTDPIVKIEEVVFFPAGSPHNFKVIEDLFSLTLVTHLGYQYPALKPHFDADQINRFDVSRDADLFVYVEQGENLDAAIADRLVGQWILFQRGMQNQFRASEATLSDYGFRIMLRPEWQPFATAFNRELARMRENGEIEAILSTYR